MNTEFANLFNNAANISGLTGDAVLVYCILRADIVNEETATVKFSKREFELVSGLSVQLVAERATLAPLTVHRLIHIELVRKEWVKPKKISSEDTAYQLGVIKNNLLMWFAKPADKTDKKDTELSEIDKIRNLLKEREGRRETKVRGMPVETKRVLAKKVMGDLIPPNMSGNPWRLLEHYLVCYRSRYKKIPPGFDEGCRPSGQLIANAKSLYLNTVDIEEAKELIYWFVMTWDVIKYKFGLTGQPEFRLLATKKFTEAALSWMRRGISLDKVSLDSIKSREETKLILAECETIKKDSGGEEGRDIDGVGVRLDPSKLAVAKDSSW